VFLVGWHLAVVVCLRGTARGTCLRPPFLLNPLEVLRAYIALFLVKNLVSTHTMCYKADHK